MINDWLVKEHRVFLRTGGRSYRIINGKKKLCIFCGFNKGEEIWQEYQEENFTHSKQNKKPPRGKYYSIWYNMVARCNNTALKAYNYYGARGIGVCSRWQFGENGLSGFDCFLADMGMRPSESHSLDRINNDGNYCKDNCRWAISAIQNRNKRNNIFVLYNGVKHIKKDAADLAGVSLKKLRHRQKMGMSLVEAFRDLGITNISET